MPLAPRASRSRRRANAWRTITIPCGRLSALLVALLLAPHPALAQTANTVQIFDTSGSTQTNRAVSLSRPFSQGEISSFAQAIVNGTPVLTQCDVKNRWPDGSLKFAVVSFVVPSLPSGGSVTVSFSNQGTGNNAGFLTQAQMLASGFGFDGTIEMTGASTQTVSARTILAAGKFRYWLQGPIVTAVIIEDRTPARTYDVDFGDGSRALHPLFEAWFYPSDNRVDLGYTVENTWASSNSANSMRDETYSLVLKGGTSPATKFTHPAFTHIGLTRWCRRFWVGTSPGSIRIDHNIRYLVGTKAIPNYDTGLLLAESKISSLYSDWLNTDKTLDGDANWLGNYNKALSAAGSNMWIGLMNTWDTAYLLTMDDRMKEMSLGNADLVGRIPWHLREADSNAGTGHYFDAPMTGSVDPFGRPVSINARRTVTLSELTNACESQYAADVIHTGPITSDGWSYYNVGRTHMPDVAYIPYLMTGRYYYLEELQYQAAYILGYKQGCYNENWERHGDDGYFNDSEPRGDAWAYRTVIYAAFISPDGSPEKAYYEDKLLNNIAKDEGKLGLSLSISSKQTQWTWGRNNQWNTVGPSPLGVWDEGNSGLVSSPVKTDGSVAEATSLWMQNFRTSALGMARDFGYPTDNLLRYVSKQMFNQLLNPVTSPYLIEGYRYATKVTATNDWIRAWSDVNKYHDLPTAWRVGEDVDHGYGFIALGTLSFLYPYSADGYTGQQAWAFLKANKPGQDRFATESPKWDIVPRNAIISGDTTPPAASNDLRVR
jgi:hypothetical protein